MAKKRLTLIHTSPVMIGVFGGLCSELLPGVEVAHMVDESLLKDILRDKRLTKRTTRRVVGHILFAAETQADVIMVTCSSIGPAAELAAQLVDVPVLRVDSPMATLAVKAGTRIGVIATLPSTLNPTAELIRAEAQKQAREVVVTAKLCDGAFEAVISGDTATHDRIVGAAIRELMQQVEVIVLAQASMARVVDGLPAESRKVPVLSSPRPAVEYIAKLL
jgi:Asp/Glu/hydantoin racemase